MKALLLLLSTALAALGQPAFPPFPAELVLRHGVDGTVALRWEPNIETNLVGYFVKYGGATTNYTNSVWVGNTNNVSIAVSGTNTLFFAVTAVNSDGLESDPSNEVSALPRRKPSQPKAIRTAYMTFPVEWTSDMANGPWVIATNFTTFYFAMTEREGYYRPGQPKIEFGQSFILGH